MKTGSEPITLVGAGLAGPLLALSLVDRGFQVEIYERRSDMRIAQVNEGRSINLALSTRGIHALQQARVWDSLQNLIIPMRGRLMHAVSGELTFQPYGKDETEVIYSISRAALNIALLNAAEERGIRIHFNQRCTDFDERTGAVHFRDRRTGDEETLTASALIASDGANSAIRAELMKGPRFNFSQQYLDYGYKELTIPARGPGRHAIETHALHIWPRGAFMLIALPNVDGTFACILFLPFEGDDSFASLRMDAHVQAFFEQHFPDIVASMPELAENYFANPAGSMVTIRCSPWHAGGKALLLGDAAHAIVPFFGQGLNCAFEDCTILLEHLDRYGPEWPKVFASFAESRKPDADAIADLALGNFVEMRDHVGDPHFLFRKKVELALEAKYPGRFVPRYSMVTFHRIPYSVAHARGAIQDRLLDELCAGIDRVEDLDWTLAGDRIQQDLAPIRL